MRVATGVEMLEISAVIMGSPNIIHPAFIWDEQSAVLVDAGYPGQRSLFHEAIEKAGVPFRRLSKIVVTHQDLDHIGSLPAILQNAGGHIDVLASEAEAPFIRGDRQLLRFTAEVVDHILASLPPDMPEQRRKAYRAAFENPPRAGVDQTVADGDELPYCGGIAVIGMPGHTPGHISLYHKPSRTLMPGTP